MKSCIAATSFPPAPACVRMCSSKAMRSCVMWMTGRSIETSIYYHTNRPAHTYQLLFRLLRAVPVELGQAHCVRVVGFLIVAIEAARIDAVAVVRSRVGRSRHARHAAESCPCVPAMRGSTTKPTPWVSTIRFLNFIALNGSWWGVSYEVCDWAVHAESMD